MPKLAKAQMEKPKQSTPKMQTPVVRLKQLNPRSPDTKYMGDEPMWKVQPTDNRNSELGKALHWYGYFYGKKEARQFILDYLEFHNRKADAKLVRAVADSDVRPTTGWLSRMCLMGLELTDQEQAKLDGLIAEMLLIKQKEPVVEVAAKDTTQKITIQDRLKEKVQECAGELEGMFDDFITNGCKTNADLKPIVLLRSNNIAPQMINTIVERWQSRLQEFQDVAVSKNAQIIEGYSNFNKIQLRNIVKFCELVINDCGSYVQIKKVERKPRKKKPVSVEKLTAKFKYLKEFAELKLVSEPVTKLVGATEAWLYDTKKRKLIHVVADQHVGSFGVKGSTIIGFDSANSVQKTLRKPADQLKALMASSVPASRKFFKDIKATDTRFNGRGNEHMIILKVK